VWLIKLKGNNPTRIDTCFIDGMERRFWSQCWTLFRSSPENALEDTRQSEAEITTAGISGWNILTALNVTALLSATIVLTIWWIVPTSAVTQYRKKISHMYAKNFQNTHYKKSIHWYAGVGIISRLNWCKLSIDKNFSGQKFPTREIDHSVNKRRQ